MASGWFVTATHLAKVSCKLVRGHRRGHQNQLQLLAVTATTASYAVGEGGHEKSQSEVAVETALVHLQDWSGEGLHHRNGSVSIE